MIREESVYKIGKLGKPHGIKGEISFMFNDDVFDRVDTEYLILKIEGIFIPFFIEEYRFRSNESALIKFEDIDSQECASELTGTEVFFPRDIAEQSGGDISFAQIIGFEVINHTSGQCIGKIVSVHDSTDNILFELEDGKLIPVAEEWIKEMNSEEKHIIMTLPEGLLEL